MNVVNQRDTTSIRHDLLKKLFGGYFCVEFDISGCIKAKDVKGENQHKYPEKDHEKGRDNEHFRRVDHVVRQHGSDAAAHASKEGN